MISFFASSVHRQSKGTTSTSLCEPWRPRVMSATDSNRELTIRSRREDGQVLVSVSDTGVGLPADKLDQIFMSFFTNQPAGTGMGRSISRAIVESHGGRLWATNSNGRGATFHFTLPMEIRDWSGTAGA